MLIGNKGVKYGLQQSARRPQATAAGDGRPPKPTTNVFGGDSDSEEDVEGQIARQAEKKRSAAKVQQMYETALADDPSVFDYDGVYDSMQEARAAPRQLEKVERQSRYIMQLKEKAEQRKREEDLAFERRQLKERQKDDHQFEDKEKFVTSAYRKKLEEDKKWKEQDKVRDEEEARLDVRKVGHMHNFYANLMTSNVSFGAADGAAPAAAAPPGSSGAAGKDAAPTPAAAAAAAASAGPAGPLDKYDALRLEMERARREHQQQKAAAAAAEPVGGADAEEGGRAAAAGDGDGGAGGSRAADGDAGTSGNAAMEEDAVGAAAAAGAGAPDSEAAAAAGKRRNAADDVMSAKERYLARKKLKGS